MFDEESNAAAPVATPAPAETGGQAALTTAPPTDILQDVDDRGSIIADASPETSVVGPSALTAGKLKQVTPPSSPPSSFSPNDSLRPPDSGTDGNLHGPTALKRILLAIIIVVAMLLVGGGAWWFVGAKGKKTTGQPAVVQPAASTESAPSVVDKNTINLDITGPATTTAPLTGSSDATPTTTAAASTTFVPPTPQPTALNTDTDTDRDGLIDTAEEKLGTDIKNPDTDGDGLTDGAEVKIWGTDPLKKDTDGDGFSDGQEVFNGYNPKGPGKLQQ